MGCLGLGRKEYEKVGGVTSNQVYRGSHTGPQGWASRLFSWTPGRTFLSSFLAALSHSEPDLSLSRFTTLNAARPSLSCNVHLSLLTVGLDRIKETLIFSVKHSDLSLELNPRLNILLKILRVLVSRSLFEALLYEGLIVLALFYYFLFGADGTTNGVDTSFAVPARNDIAGCDAHNVIFAC